jgi:hypothetical protein
MNKHKRDFIVSVLRIQDLALKSKDVNLGEGVFKGLMIALTVMFEEYHGLSLDKRSFSPREVMAWAAKVKMVEDLV